MGKQFSRVSLCASENITASDRDGKANVSDGGVANAMRVKKPADLVESKEEAFATHRKIS